MDPQNIDILVTLSHLKRLIQYVDSKESVGGDGVIIDPISTIEAEATVDDSTGEPSVQVSKSVLEGVVRLLFAFSGLKGEKGDSGVYIGSGDIPEGFNIQVDTEGDATVISDGVTFYPEMSEDGTLSWTNNGGLENPTAKNLKGPEGKSAYQLAQDKGFKGTLEEWLESLVGTIVDITNISAEINTESGIPEVEVQVTGTDTEKDVHFIFKNLKGTKGDKGNKGDQGDIGVTPNLQIGSIQTLPTGQRATVTIDGTPEEPRIHFGIPAGSRGYTPTRGIDYYTQADKEALLAEISALFLGGYKFDVSETIPPPEEDDGKTITLVFPPA